MSEVTITVRGASSTDVAPEIAIPAVAVRVEGADRAEVVARATRLAAEISANLRDFVTEGAVSSWSSDQASVWSDRPWNAQGEQLPLVHHAAISSRAEFTDFAALSGWLTSVTELDGVAIDNVQWKLTPERLAQVEAEVAQAAVGVAVGRAHAYAAALGLTRVTPVEVADHGLLARSSTEHAAPEARMFSAAAFSADASSGVALEPGQITVATTVEARFLAA